MGTVKLLLLYCLIPYILPKIFCVWVKFFRRYILTKPIDLHPSAAAVHHKSDRPSSSLRHQKRTQLQRLRKRSIVPQRNLVVRSNSLKRSPVIKHPSSKANPTPNTEETIELQALKICAVVSFSSGNVGETIGSSPQKVTNW